MNRDLLYDFEVIKRISNRYLVENNVDKKNMYLENAPKVVVIDTGVYAHKELKNSIKENRNFVRNSCNISYDDNGHGTHIAGIIHMINPYIEIISFKVLNGLGFGNTDDVIEAINQVIYMKNDMNIKMMNISLGGTDTDNDINNRLINAVERVWESGIVVVSAAGNNGPNKGSVTSPGVSKKIITVGMVEDLNKANSFARKYSGRGPTKTCIVKPDILCTGREIKSYNNAPFGYKVKSGTSMATAVLTGSISCLYMVDEEITPKMIKKRLKDTSVKKYMDIDVTGFGIFDIESFLYKS